MVVVVGWLPWLIACILPRSENLEPRTKSQDEGQTPKSWSAFWRHQLCNICGLRCPGNLCSSRAPAYFCYPFVLLQKQSRQQDTIFKTKSMFLSRTTTRSHFILSSMRSLGVWEALFIKHVRNAKHATRRSFHALYTSAAYFASLSDYSVFFFSSQLSCCCRWCFSAPWG